MKKIVIASLILFATCTITDAQTSVNASPSLLIADNASFNWTETNFDFGKIKLNVPVTHEFKFTNKGSAPLVITSVHASCGCTVAEYSKDAIAPGQQGFVRATYNAAKEGAFAKTVTINANTEETSVVLNIKGIVTN